MKKKNDRQKKEMEEISKLLDQEKVQSSKLRSEVSSLSDNMGSRN
jgi:hypothetical protein